MYNFAELLRARSTLRGAAIVYGIILVMAIVARIVAGNSGNVTFVEGVQSSSTAHKTVTKLPDGTTRTVIDDPARHVHAVIIEGRGRLHIDMTRPAKGTSKSETTYDGSTVYKKTRVGNMEHVVLDRADTQQIPIGIVFMTSLIAGLIVASKLAGPLAKENDGHLDVVWTAPVSRERYAAGAIAIDLGAILVAQIVWVVLAYVCMLMFFVPHLSLGGGDALEILASILSPFAWYAAMTAYSASLKRGPGMVVGISWVVGFLVPAIAGATAQLMHPLAKAIHAVFAALAYIDPLTYIPSHVTNSVVLVGPTHTWTLTVSVIGSLALFVVYIALALLQWRRLEA